MRDEIKRRNTKYVGADNTIMESHLSSHRLTMFQTASFSKKFRQYESTYKLRPDEKPEVASIEMILNETLESKLKSTINQT